MYMYTKFCHNLKILKQKENIIFTVSTYSSKWLFYFHGKYMKFWQYLSW